MISKSDLPTSEVFVPTFFWEKVWLRKTLPAYNLDIAQNFFLARAASQPHTRGRFVRLSVRPSLHLYVPNFIIWMVLPELIAHPGLF